MPLRPVAGAMLRPARLLTTKSSQAQAQARQYTCSAIRGYPTAIARAERAADLKKHPESALTQQKLEDKKGNRHWSEENATLSEADVRADHEAEAKKAEDGEKKDGKSTQ